MRRGDTIPAGYGSATILADMDFETYSEAGYQFDPDKNRWRLWDNVPQGTRSGLAAVGAPAYSEHETTEVLSLAYDLKDGIGPRLWTPDFPPPVELFEFIKSGGLLEAWNSSFEFLIWQNVCRPRMGWPDLPFWQLRDAMAKSLAFSMPSALGKCGLVIGASNLKIDDGTRLINKFSKPRNPTKANAAQRLKPSDDPADAAKLYEYNIGDIIAEADISMRLPDLSPSETELWLLDQHINFKGVHIDQQGLADCIRIVEQAKAKYTTEMQAITGGVVANATEVAKIVGWLGANGCVMGGLDKDAVQAKLAKFKLFDDLTAGGASDAHPLDIEAAYQCGQLPNAGACQRVLQIRAVMGSASVKKLYAIKRRLTRDGRLKDMFMFCGADRTGRFAGRGPQPHNMPASGPAVYRCPACGSYHGRYFADCPSCRSDTRNAQKMEWNNDAVDWVFDFLQHSSLDDVEHIFEDSIDVISGCLRGLFCAAPGYDLVCADYNAIEAVVLAVLAGEQWRIDVFNTHGKIYEQTASDISGIPFDEFLAHKGRTGEHHPLRSKIGKVAELASGFQGSVGAWKQFGADDYFESDEDILTAVRAWRAKSPAIVKFWYGMEDAAVAAVQHPGQCYEFRGLKFGVLNDVLYLELLSGRKLCYHDPRLHEGETPYGRKILKLSYMGWNSDYKKGPTGWMRLETYGGKLCENATQATARDILTNGMMNAQRGGYQIVLHVHDEDVAEIPVGLGSVDELEALMTTLPHWAANWPVKATGGWRGRRYRKD